VSPRDSADLVHADVDSRANARQGASPPVERRCRSLVSVGIPIVREPLREIVDDFDIAGALLDVAVHAKLERFVLVSSGGVVYGEARRLPIAEDH
jgi:nucleoside-diphosphate-sugar epimerase